MKGGENVAKRPSALEKKDDKMDKKLGIKEGSKKDKQVDKILGVKDNDNAKPKAKAKKKRAKSKSTGGMTGKTMGVSIGRY